MRLVLWLLAVSVLAQAVLAGLFLDGNDAWRDWHATNGMVLAIASVGLLLAILLQIAMGQAGQLAVHVPLGVAIFGLVGTLLGRTRNLTPPATHPTSP
jgi:hypothetical protein